MRGCFLAIGGPFSAKRKVSTKTGQHQGTHAPLNEEFGQPLRKTGGMGITRVVIGLPILVLTVIFSSQAAAASCGSAELKAAQAQATFFEFEKDAFRVKPNFHAAFSAYKQGALLTRSARNITCHESKVNADVLLASASLLVVHSTLELNTSPDNEDATCARAHEVVAASNVAEAWTALRVITNLRRVTHATPRNFTLIQSQLRMVANRLAIVLPPYSATDAQVERFMNAYPNLPGDNCVHFPEP